MLIKRTRNSSPDMNFYIFLCPALGSVIDPQGGPTFQ